MASFPLVWFNSPRCGVSNPSVLCRFRLVVVHIGVCCTGILLPSSLFTTLVLYCIIGPSRGGWAPDSSPVCSWDSWAQISEAHVQAGWSSLSTAPVAPYHHCRRQRNRAPPPPCSSSCCTPPPPPPPPHPLLLLTPCSHCTPPLLHSLFLLLLLAWHSSSSSSSSSLSIPPPPPAIDAIFLYQY